jgi:uncharacterized protein (TIGR02453 family)
MLTTATIQFLKALKKNNNKPWFDVNRKKYEVAKQDFEAFIQVVIDKHSKKDPSIAQLKAKECLFRINRDVRFSKDKSPYKTNFGASINPGGKKSMLAGYYFHCEPGGESFVGGGIWMPQPPELKKMRQEVDYCFDEFKKILTNKKFKSVYGNLYSGDDMKLVKVPAGFEKENPAAEYLKLKSFIAMKPISEKELSSGNLLKNTTDAMEALQPMLAFINRTMQE